MDPDVITDAPAEPTQPAAPTKADLQSAVDELMAALDARDQKHAELLDTAQKAHDAADAEEAACGAFGEANKAANDATVRVSEIAHKLYQAGAI